MSKSEGQEPEFFFQLLAFALLYAFGLGGILVTGLRPFHVPRCFAWYSFCARLDCFYNGVNLFMAMPPLLAN